VFFIKLSAILKTSNTDEYYPIRTPDTAVAPSRNCVDFG